MLATRNGSVYRKSQDRFIRKNRSYLEKKGDKIKPVKFSPSASEDAPKPKDKTEQNKSVEKLEALVDTVSRPLLVMTTLPILEIFPTTITLDLKKITIKTTTFYKSHSIQTITYDYLKEVSLETNLIASSLRLVLVGNSMNPIVLPNFPKKQAAEAKRIILGLMQCQKHQIKPDELDPVRDKKKIISLGAAASS